ncbi:MAG: 2-C-methyl-D-erythritol 4-phosphate cytidylyltransferase [Oscillospiraceae bacterium]|nr:2-C-methyl-D-erythritol 4-phosphate cytidylyltransferase [Oscillospiraceae bacterium]MCI9562563.1 2-C-methyl-D-erythritol 4-phosphate cytidylyltransferase [Oscillospiraceae bacterium]
MKLFSKLFGKKENKADHPFCSVIVAAAGSSRRMEGQNKLMLPLDGIPVLARTLLALDGSRLIDEIVVAVREEDLLPTGDLCRLYGVTKPVKIVRGGESRLDSVLAAAMECREDAVFLAVHDGARPLADPELIDRVVALAHRTNAAAPAVPVKDTIKVVRDGRVESTPDRALLRAVQTPQVFDAQLLRAALQSAQTLGAEITDDCSAVERLGKEVYLTEGSYENIKITTPEDMLLACELLRRREERP